MAEHPSAHPFDGRCDVVVPRPAPVLGRVVGLHVTAGAGAPVRDRTWIDVSLGIGVCGDCYAAGTGHWSDARWPDQEVTMFEAEVAEGLLLPAGLMRRNIVTRGVRLEHLIGECFRVGGSELLGVCPCDPCRYLEQLVRFPGLAARLRDVGGLRSEVVSGGRIALGDELRTGIRS